MIPLKDIERYVDETLPRAREIRHAIHRNPEPALEEHDTAALVRRTLAETGAEIRAPLLGTDVVALLHGKEAGPHVALRADMDALPLEEKTGVPWSSQIPGRMHACGHDGHTAALLGAALVLNRLRERFPGSVRFVFQPGEEVRAAGRDLVARGALADPTPRFVFALHAAPGLPTGSIQGMAGATFAASDQFAVTIHGRGGHGSRPEQATDPIAAGAAVVQALQTVVARKIGGLQPAVISICRFTAGHSSNVIPDDALLEGTCRYLGADVGDNLPRWVEDAVKAGCGVTGAEYELRYDRPYIPTVNAPEAVGLAATAVRDALGEACWREQPEPAMMGEDFCYYVRECAGALLGLGMGPESAPLHSAAFDWNDDALRNAVMFHVSVALRVLFEAG
ncbi:MAG: M20 metallopeptidase family protein [Pirellulales bacterium]